MTHLRFPFEPPLVRFLTPIHHPNIDDGGRICLDTLNMPPKGSWNPSLSLCSVLTTVQQLMSEPNPDDGLHPEVTRQFRDQRHAFDAQAREETRRHARGDADTMQHQPDTANSHAISTAASIQAATSGVAASASLAVAPSPSSANDSTSTAATSGVAKRRADTLTSARDSTLGNDDTELKHPPAKKSRGHTEAEGEGEKGKPVAEEDSNARATTAAM